MSSDLILNDDVRSLLDAVPQVYGYQFNCSTVALHCTTYKNIPDSMYQNKIKS